MGSFLSDASNQRKIAVALCAVLGLFSSKIPFLANVNPEMVAVVIATVAAWILQSGVKAAAQAHADGAVNAAMVANAEDAAEVFNKIAQAQTNNLLPLQPPVVEKTEK